MSNWGSLKMTLPIVTPWYAIGAIIYAAYALYITRKGNFSPAISFVGTILVSAIWPYFVIRILWDLIRGPHVPK